VLRALADGPRAIVLLDGVYFTEPSVTHKELLYALEAGVRVIGAGSLGALRAAELAAHGMEGVGRVFERFRDGELDGDDEVALLHAPAERAYLPLTLALVELREAVAELVRRGVVAETAGGELVAAVKALPFSDRTLERVRELAGELLVVAPGARVADALCRRLEEPGVKWCDALAALALGGSAPRRAPAAARTPETEFSVWFKEEHLRARVGPRVRAGAAEAPTLLQVLRAVQLLHPAAPDLVRRLRLRFLLATEGAHAGLEPAAEELEDVAAELAAGSLEAGPPPLPAPELRAEARVRLLAEAACRRHGGPGAALGSLARRLGLSARRAEADLLTLVASRRGLLADWSVARGLALAGAHSPALPAALAAAAAADEVHRCFLRWRGEDRTAWVPAPVLREVAAALWGRPAGGIEAEAVRRGLYPSTGHSPGLYEALAWLAPAERLGEPINRYPEARAALRATNLLSDRLPSPRPTQPVPLREVDSPAMRRSGRGSA